MMYIVFLMGVWIIDGAVPSIDIGGGVMMPQVGLGTCCGKYDAPTWISLGGRYLDSAIDYGSQGTIGKAVSASGIDRKEFFIVSKIEPENYTVDMSVVMEKDILQSLKMTYIDLLLLHQAGRESSDRHWKPPCYDQSMAGKNGSWYQCRLDGWVGAKKLKAQGKVRAIGVSNYGEKELKQYYEFFKEYPAVNQIEFHPYYHEDSADALDIASTVSYCKTNGIRVTAYAPNADYPRSRMLDDPAVKALAKEVGRTPSQVAQRWILQTLGTDNVIIIPRSKTAEHMKQNLGLFDWSLTTDQMKELDNLKQQKVYGTTCEPFC